MCLGKMNAMFDRYTDDAKKAMYCAILEASHRGDDCVGPGDLLLGLCWVCPSRAHRVAEICDRRGDIRAGLGVQHFPMTAQAYKPDLRRVKFSEDGAEALACAFNEVERRGRVWIDSDDLLRGLLRFRNPAADVLSSFGITLEQLREKAKIDRREYPHSERPSVC